MGKRIVFFDGSTGNSKYLKPDEKKIPSDFFENPDKNGSPCPDIPQSEIESKIILIREKLYMFEKISSNIDFPKEELLVYLTQFERNLNKLQNHLRQTTYSSQSIDYNINISECATAKNDHYDSISYPHVALTADNQLERDGLERQKQEREEQEREEQEREEQEREKQEREEQEREEQEREKREREEREREAEFWHMQADLARTQEDESLAATWDNIASLYED